MWPPSSKLKRTLPQGIPHEVTIEKHLGEWQLSISYWKPAPPAELKTHDAGAADAGIQPLAVDSQLVHYLNPKALYKHLKQLKRWQRKLARRTKDSRGWHQAQERINSIWGKITGLRNDTHHQLSRLLVRKYRVLCIESPNVKGMDKLRFQAKAVRDAAIGGLLNKVKYKGNWYGTLVVEAPRSFPSSKTCSNCNNVNRELKREKHWTCPNCETYHQRDENAVINLLGIAQDAARDLHKSTLGAVGPDVTLPDAKALTAPSTGRKAGKKVCETGTEEGRTAPPTLAGPAVGWGVAGKPGNRRKAKTQTQLMLPI